MTTSIHGFPRLWAALTAACTLGTSGCIGGQSSDDGPGRCDHGSTPLTDETQPSPDLGIAIADVTSWALGSVEATARWRDPPGGITTNAAPGDVGVTLRLDRGEGEAVEVSGCDPRVEIPVALTFTTADGLLSEAVPAALRAGRAGFARVDAALDFETLGGSLEWQSSSSKVALVQPGLSVAVTPHGMAGSFGAILQTGSGSGVSPRGAGLLAWPGGSRCAGGTVPRDLDSAAASWRDALAYGRSQPWDGTSEGGSFVMTLDAAETLCDAADGAVSTPATLHVDRTGSTEAIAVRGSFSEKDGRLVFAEAEDAHLSDSASRFIERFGTFGLDLGGYEAVVLEPTFWLDPGAGGGTLIVAGYTDDCAAECTGNGCDGCGPLTRHVLRTVTWSAGDPS